MRALVAVLLVMLGSMVVLLLSSCIAVPVTPGGSTLPVATVTVAPLTPGVEIGESVRLSATLKDADGTLLSDRLVLWFTSNPDVATVSSTGLVTGVSEGTITVAATSEGQTGTTTVTVSPPATVEPTAPGTVTDLTVSTVGASSVTLSFTEVDDGTGAPAKYDIRFAPSPISWGTATHVFQGTCAMPVAGTAIGATRNCTVQGLATSAEYQFQLVPFRGTLDVDAVYGGLSNVATSTTGSSAAPVASVTITPASATLGVGGLRQLTAVLKDADGNTLSGRPVTWSTSNLLVATITPLGLVTGIVPGTSTITASSEGQSGTSSITVTLASLSEWPNEPAGLISVRDTPWDAAPPISGWYASENEDRLATVIADLTAPLSPGSVLQFRYPVGFGGGWAPATVYAPVPEAKEYFVGFWWKPSKSWHGHSSWVNKLMFFFTESNTNVVLTMYGPSGGPYHLRAITQGMPSGGQAYLTQNVRVMPVELGEWHRIELYLRYQSSPGAGDAVIRWWVNGLLVGDHSNLTFPSDGGFREFQLSPTWGGVNGSKNQEDFFWFDHVYLSRR